METLVTTIPIEKLSPSLPATVVRSLERLIRSKDPEIAQASLSTLTTLIEISPSSINIYDLFFGKQSLNFILFISFHFFSSIIYIFFHFNVVLQKWSLLLSNFLLKLQGHLLFLLNHLHKIQAMILYLYWDVKHSVALDQFQGHVNLDLCIFKLS